MGLIVITITDLDEFTADVRMIAEPGLPKFDGSPSREEMEEMLPCQMLARKMLAPVADSLLHNAPPL